MDKHDLRKKMMAARKNFFGKKQASSIIAAKVMKLAEWKQAKKICLYESLSTEVDTKELFIAAKKQKKIVTWKAADLYIVPGVAFDRQRNRLGRGRGYYDKLLAGVTAPKIGLAFSVQMVDKVPRASYDIPMTRVITEK